MPSKTIKYLLFIIGLLLSACLFTPVNTNTDLLGYWTQESHQDTIVTFQRADSMPDNDYSFGFFEKGLFKERKNIGWCGTPPITYGDYEGTWSMSDSLITIDVPYWGGMIRYTWRLLEVNKQELKVVRIYE